MPNHVKNILKADGITKLPLFTEDEEGKRCFDFNKIIPMPPTLSIESGSIEDLAIASVIRKVAKTRYSFEKPCVISTMNDVEYMNRRVKSRKSEEELLELGLQYIANKVRYGATTWYDWRVENWGTKWNAYCNSEIDADTVSFETAWSFPKPVVVQLSKMYPDLKIEIWFADEDMGNNTGHAVYLNGGEVGGEAFESFSNEAYETYIHCWVESKYLKKDESGN